MRIETLSLAPAALLRLDRKPDPRGWFARSFCLRTMAAHGLHTDYPQHNISHNVAAGTLRGLHFQHPPHAEVKIVSCTRGAVFDVIVDLRHGSATRGQWLGVELSAANGDALYIPAGFAHGFQALSDDSEVRYLMGCEYVEGAAGGVRYDDPGLAIAWPLPVTTISDRDRALPRLHESSLA